MKKQLKRIISVVLVLSLVLSAGSSVYAYPAVQDEIGDISRGKAIVNAFGVVADALIIGVARMFPSVDWPDIEDYQSENFYTGTSSFKTGYQQGDVWYAGYGSRSIVPDDLAERGYTVAGEFHITQELCYDMLEGDDQRVNAVALKVNQNGETVIFASIDGFGMTSTNVRRIRERLEDFAEQNNIVSINVTMSHAHSCIDTHGLGASILGLVGDSILRGLLKPLSIFGYKYEKESTDDAFMELVYSQAQAAVTEAVNSMKPGTMSFASYDISDMVYDKQLPDVCDRNVNRIKFVPVDTNAREIWLVNMGVHPVRMGGKGVASSDYPGALVRYASETQNADVAFYQGAQLAITREESVLKLDEDAQYNAITDEAEKAFYAVCAYAKEIVTRMSGTPVESFPIEPILNIRHTEFNLGVDNSLLLLISKLQMINNIVVNTSWDFTDARIITEVGYCELGSNLAIGMMPGELDPEIAFGGTRTAAESWNGTDWQFAPYKDMVGGRKLIMFGITNDQIGYIVPDNDYAHAFASLFQDQIGGSRNKHYEEMISLGSNTASGVAQAFSDTVNSTKQ